jgi:hypothetical protein
MEAWVGCLAGALEIDTYRDLLTQAGFVGLEIEITRRYSVAGAGLDTGTLPSGWQDADGKLASAFIRATKPAAGVPVAAPAITTAATSQSRSCCGPECCN